MVMDLEPLVLDKASNRPKTLEIRVMCNLVNQNLIAQLSRIFSRYPGNDNVDLLVEESSGQTLRAELPMHVNTKNLSLAVEVEDILRGQGSVLVA